MGYVTDANRNLNRLTPTNKNATVLAETPANTSNFPWQTCGKQVPQLTKKGMKYGLCKAFMSNYFLDRVANGVSFDEPMQYYGQLLGYTDLQMPFNTNTNGTWSYENIYIGLPTTENLGGLDNSVYDWKFNIIHKRWYPYIERGGYTDSSAFIFNRLFQTTLSSQDPFGSGQSAQCQVVFPCNGTTGGLQCAPPSDDYPSSRYHRTTCSVAKNAGQPSGRTAEVIKDTTTKLCMTGWGQKNIGNVNGGNMGSMPCGVPTKDGNPPLSTVFMNAPIDKVKMGYGVVPLVK